MSIGVMTGNIPAELTRRDYWVLWRLEVRDGRETKVPYTADGQYARTNDATTWTSYERAAAVYANPPADQEPFDGIGFVFARGDGLVGIDLDNCRNPETSEIVPAAMELIRRLATYTEISPSGCGVKAFGAAEIDLGGTGVRRPTNLWPDGQIEIYNYGRYFTVTADHVEGTPDELCDVGEAVQHLYDQLVAPAQQLDRASELSSSDCHISEFNDELVLARARRASNAEAFTQLWEGNWRGVYPSQSEADSALCCQLAFWTRSAEQIDRLFRRSRLMRPKWDEARGSETYGSITVRGALAVVTEQYTSAAENVPSTPGEPGNREALVPAGLISNYIAVLGANGQIERLPLRLSEISSLIDQRMDGWPRSVKGDLFIHDEQGRMRFLDKPPKLFAEFCRVPGQVDWKGGGAFVSHEQLFYGLQVAVRAYDGAEELPHFPPIDTYYYAHPPIQPGDGSALNELLDRFSYATPSDRESVLAMFVTPGLGVLGGVRPGFLITSEFGRGVGKSVLAHFVSQLWGGNFEVGTSESIEGLKKRLLTIEASTKRIVIYDNVKAHKFSSADLEGLITSEVISGHRLYSGERVRPNNITVIITMNGPSLSRDLAQRCVVIRLGRPEYTGDWEEQTREFIRANRWRILADVAAFYTRPPQVLERYSRWGRWEREVLARLCNPADLQRLTLERQAQYDADSDEGAELEDFFRESLRQLHYNPDSDAVHIPSQLAVNWYRVATNKARISTSAFTRLVNQGADEGTLRSLSVNPSRTHGRGIVWRNGPVNSPILYDLHLRVADQQRHGSLRFDD